jgi:hypothetical protein
MKHFIILAGVFLFSCVSQKIGETETIHITTNKDGRGNQLTLEFIKGPSHNYPSMAIWVEDLEGKYLETLYVTRYVATGTYGRGELQPGQWSNQPGAARRPATLPYWAHKRGIRASDGLYIPSPENPVPDALTSATPSGNFNLNTFLSENKPGKFRILLEINQAWDSNKFWTNNKYPGDLNYYGSLQPSLVYAATVDPADTTGPVYLNPIGHGHPSGADGRLFTDLTTLTTAKEIIHSVNVRFK